MSKEEGLTAHLVPGAMRLCLPLPGVETLREAAGNRRLIGCAVATCETLKTQTRAKARE